MKQINIPPIRIPEFRMPSLGLSTIGLPADRSGNRLAWPSGLKDSIVCWYSPRKQGLTEYDVIESYAEDFTTWRHLDSRGTAAVTPNKITITESFDTTNIVEYVEEPYSDISIYVTGVSEDVPLVVRDITGNKAIITKDGKYDFSKNSRFMGFAINKILSNINVVISLLPTSILKDLSGNGNHAYLYGGKGKLNSGMGLYKVDFTSWRKSSVQTEVKPDVVKVTPNTSNYLFIQYANSVEIPSYKIKVIGLGDNVLKYQYATENGRKEINIVEGENELPTSIKVSNDYQIGYRLTPGTSVFTITQIPDYPDQLCYNGSSYGIAYGLPILSDYTIIADRTWFENNGNRVFANKGNIWPNCAFTFEKINVSLNSETFSFSQSTGIDDLRNKSGITYQTKQSYNGNPISFGDSSDGEVLVIGGQITGEFVGCHGDILLFNRTLTDDEITWLKENWEKL